MKKIMNRQTLVITFALFCSLLILVEIITNILGVVF